MKSTLKIIFINFGIFCTLVMSLEAFGQMVYYVTKGYFIFQTETVVNDNFHHHELFEHHPYLVGRLKKNVSIAYNDITISTTEYHTRFTGAPENDEDLIRIATLGGSTTFGTSVTDRDSWPMQLQTKLGSGYSIRNYGAPGFSTAEAVVQLALVVSEWKPHYVILYQGWNDIRNYFDETITPDYYNHGRMQSGNLRLPLYEKGNIFEKTSKWSAIFRFASNLNRRFSFKRKEPVEIYSIPDKNVDKIYLRNLELLKVLSNHLSATAIFIPQILNDEF